MTITQEWMLSKMKDGAHIKVENISSRKQKSFLVINDVPTSMSNLTFYKLLGLGMISRTNQENKTDYYTITNRGIKTIK